MNYGQANHILQQAKAETPMWVRALEMEFTDDGSPHTASYKLGWQAGVEAAAQSFEQTNLASIQDLKLQTYTGRILMTIAANIRSLK